MRNASDKSFRESRNTCIGLYNLLKNPAICEEMPIHIVEPDRPQMIVWCMHIACWITKATNVHSENVTPTAFPL